MKRISSTLRHVHAVVTNRIRVHALTSIKPNDSVKAFRLLQRFGWRFYQVSSDSYVLECSAFLPKKCLLALEGATKASWSVVRANIFLQNSLPKSQIIADMLSEAFHLKASDIFLEISKDFASIKFRVRRVLTEQRVIPVEEGKGIVKALFALANLGQDDALYNREGHFSYEIDGKYIFFRLSFIASEISQSLVLRLLSEKLFPFEVNALCLPQDLGNCLNEIVRASHTGMILISGSTGSGKTTTAYTLAKLFAENGRKVISIEDPIEAELSNVIQSEIKATQGYSFCEAMNAILRQDPDVIMVGEIRDAETARAAFYASLSGYWVITTIHSECLQNVSFRCEELGITFSEFSDNVKLQIHQQWGKHDHPEFAWQKK